MSVVVFTILMTGCVVYLINVLVSDHWKIKERTREILSNTKTHPVKKSYSLADDLNVSLFDLIQQAELEASPDYVPPNSDGCLCTINNTCTACEFRKKWEENKNKTIVLPKGVELISHRTPDWENEANAIAAKMVQIIAEKIKEDVPKQTFGYRNKLADGTQINAKVTVELQKPYDFSITEKNGQVINLSMMAPSRCKHTEYEEMTTGGSLNSYLVCVGCGYTWEENLYNTDML